MLSKRSLRVKALQGASARYGSQFQSSYFAHMVGRRYLSSAPNASKLLQLGKDAIFQYADIELLSICSVHIHVQNVHTPHLYVLQKKTSFEK